MVRVILTFNLIGFLLFLAGACTIELASSQEAPGKEEASREGGSAAGSGDGDGEPNPDLQDLIDQLTVFSPDEVQRHRDGTTGKIVRTRNEIINERDGTSEIREEDVAWATQEAVIARPLTGMQEAPPMEEVNLKVSPAADVESKVKEFCRTYNLLQGKPAEAPCEFTGSQASPVALALLTACCDSCEE